MSHSNINNKNLHIWTTQYAAQVAVFAPKDVVEQTNNSTPSTIWQMCQEPSR